jgi:hypothetical protein
MGIRRPERPSSCIRKGFFDADRRRKKESRAASKVAEECEPSSKAQDARDSSGRRPWRAQCEAIKKIVH